MRDNFFSAKSDRNFSSIRSFIHISLFTISKTETEIFLLLILNFTEFLFIIRFNCPLWWPDVGNGMSALCGFFSIFILFARDFALEWHCQLWKVDSIIDRVHPKHLKHRNHSNVQRQWPQVYSVFVLKLSVFCLVLRDNQTAADWRSWFFFSNFVMSNRFRYKCFLIGVFLAIKFDSKRNKRLNYSFIYEWQLQKRGWLSCIDSKRRAD